MYGHPRSNDAVAATYEQLRRPLLAIAYRMTGSVSEAEDLVQEAFLRYHRVATRPPDPRAASAGEPARSPEPRSAPGGRAGQRVDGRSTGTGVEIESPKAYLVAVTTRLAIDHLRSARVRRERYVGSWLPEPLVTGVAADAAWHAESADSLSMAFLVVLERLSPVERAVFLLRDVFGYGYDEIARIVDKREGNCRQLAARARRRVRTRQPRFEASRRQGEELGRRFLAALEDGDTDGLVGMLAEDAVMYGDGGGKAPAVVAPIHGRKRIARFLLGLSRQARRIDVRVRPAEVNGQPGALAYDGASNLVNVLSFEIADGLVRAIRSVVNPDKLHHLGQVGDLPRLLRGEGPAPAPPPHRT